MGVISSTPCNEEVPPTCQRYNWMGLLLADAQSDFGSQKLFEIAIPATHNSATYDIESNMVSSIAMCQKYDILHQLRSGVRLLDLRVCDDTPDGVLTISHRFLCGSLGKVFHQIHSFLYENKSEIIVVGIKKDWDRELSESGFNTVIQMIINYFGEYLITRQDLESLSIRELVSQNKRVHFLSPRLNESHNFISKVSQTWETTNSPYCKKLIENLSTFEHEKGLPQIKVHDCYLTPSPESITYWCLNRTNWHQLQKDTNRKVLSWLRLNLGKIRFNAISVDMIDQEIIDFIISMNSRTYEVVNLH